VDAEQRYAVQNGGVLDLIEEAKLSPISRTDMVAA
jgi:hypothetical protein